MDNRDKKSDKFSNEGGSPRNRETDKEESNGDKPKFLSVAMAVMKPTDALSAQQSIFDSRDKLRGFDNSDILGINKVRSTPPQFNSRTLKTPDKSSSWKVNELPPVPPGYSLKRGYRRVSAASHEVSARISDCLRSRSIHAEYAKDEVLAKCKNSNSVHFNIRLFAGDEGSVIVHVHRMMGCGFSFREDYFAILDAAEDIDTDLCEDRSFIPPSIKEVKPLDTKILEEAVSNSDTHLQSGNRELQVFALQHIAAMTDPTKSSETTSLEVSKIIMKNPEGVRRSLAILLINGSLNEKTSERYSDKENTQLMKNIGLTILANIMTAISKDGTLDHVIKGQAESNFFTDDLMPALFMEVKDCEFDPHNAYLAAKSLSILFKHSSTARTRCKSVDGCLTLLEAAVKYGARSHASLQEEAANAILNVYKY